MLKHTLVIVAVVTVGWSTAEAATINVPADFSTIQAAIDDAGTVNGDVIIVAPGTYTENINFNGKAITVRSTDPSDAGVVMATVIDGTGFLHVVQCVSGEGADTVLSGFVITGGNANGAVPDNLGGGMYCSFASPTVSNCTFSGNSADSIGGGLFLANGSPTVSNCSFIGNFGGNFGGGLHNQSSTATVSNCSFIGNTAGQGGGMSNSGGGPTVVNCTFSGNVATIFGGGMRNFNVGTVTVTDCTFSGNSAATGGGMYMSNSSTPTVSNTGFCGNTPNQIAGEDPIIDGGGNSLLYCAPPSRFCPADITGPGGVPDGTVVIGDFLGLLANWGSCFPSAA